jgi:hypothetical protein
MRVTSKDNDNIITYQDSRGLIIRDKTEYYKSKGFDLDDSVDVVCPHCYSFLGHFPNIEAALAAEITDILTCEHGHIFCSQCVPDWRESGEPYCAVCQNAAQEQFFAVLTSRGFEAALAEFNPAASKQTLYKACIAAGLNVVYYNGNIYPVIPANGNSLVFEDVSLHDYILFLHQVFQVDDRDLHLDGTLTPQNFARIVENRLFEPLIGGAQFGTFEAPDGGRGWVYETFSGRRLYFIPNSDLTAFGSLYCVGLDKSINFRQKITSFFGVPKCTDLPDVGPIAWLRRPFAIHGWIKVYDNSSFWAIASKNAD